MRVRLFGAVEVELDGVSVSAGRPQAQTVLALLAMQPRTAVPVGRLIDELWPGEPPAEPKATIQTNVSSLRRALGGERDRLAGTPGGYVLDLDDDAVDALRFVELVRDGHGLAGVDPDGARARLDGGLALWRGPPFAGLTERSSALAAEAVRLAELRLSAVERRAELLLRSGASDEAIADLERELAVHPTRERIVALLLRALTDAGRRPEALDRYLAFRDTLVEQVGVEPSEQLQRLHARLLRARGGGAKRARDGHARSPLPVDVPHPLRAEVESGPPLVGRAGALSRLESSITAAVQGRRRLVLVSGEAGIGKTRLVAEAAVRAHRRGAVVLLGREDRDLVLPYRGPAEALRRVVEELGSAPLGRYPGDLVRLVPELREAVDDLPEPLRSDHGTEQFRLFEAVASWLRETADGGEVLLLLEDLQWAGSETVDLLRHLVRADDLSGVLLLATCRDTDVDADHPLGALLGELHRTPGTEHVQLDGLDEAAIADLLDATARDVARAPGHGELVADLRRTTAGNPLFLREVLPRLLEAFRDGPVGSVGAPAELLAFSPPDSLMQALQRRLARLSGAGRRVLQAAAVLGAEAEIDVLERTSGASRDELLSAFDEAAALQLTATEDDGRVLRFRHDLIRAALLEELALAQRAAFHDRAVAALEATRADLEEVVDDLARHALESAALGGVDRAATYVAQAAVAALGRNAPGHAIPNLERALSWVGDHPERRRTRARLLVLLGTAQRDAGRPEWRQTLMSAASRAREGGYDDLLVDAAVALTSGLPPTRPGGEEEIRHLLRRAIEVAGPGTSARVRLLTGLARQLEALQYSDATRPVGDLREVSVEALTAARDLDDAATLMDATMARMHAIRGPRDLAETQQLGTQLARLTDRVADPVLRAGAAYERCYVGLMAADSRGYEQAIGDFDAAVAEAPTPLTRWRWLYTHAGRAALHGDLDEGDRLAQEALDLATRIGETDPIRSTEAMAVYIGYQYAASAVRSGRDLLLVGLMEAGPEPDPDDSMAQTALLYLHLQSGDLAAARPVFDRLLDNPTYDFLWANRLIVLAEGAVRLAVPAGVAERVLGDLQPISGQLSTTDVAAAHGAVDRWIGAVHGYLGDLDAAEQDFERAVAIEESIAAPVLAAATRLAWATVLSRYDHRVRDACGLALRARDAGAAHGADRLHGDADDLLRSIGGPAED